jgi:branched-chain amino acid transport system permease protein
MTASRIVPVGLGALALALWPLATGSYGLDLVTKTMIYAVLALSLELLVGTTGLVCFGQAALFGLAGYAVVQLSPTRRRPCSGCCRYR